MQQLRSLLILIAAVLTLSGCVLPDKSPEAKESESVAAQQEQYAIGQPIPKYDFSLERDLLISLYNLRNDKVATHAVWRSDFGNVEGDCPSLGYGLPYDTSLTNPLQLHSEWRHARSGHLLEGVVGQAEPNGVFASTNTAATWIMCTGAAGLLEPVYVEAKVTVYPYPVTVDYETNRVVKAGKAAATIKAGGK